MQGMYVCFLIIALLKSVAALKDGGVNVIPGHDIQTTTPADIPAGDLTANKTGNQFENLTDNDRRDNSAHSEKNISKIRTNIVAISVSLTIISALCISLVVFLKKRGFCKRTQMQLTESYEITEPLNN